MNTERLVSKATMTAEELGAGGHRSKLFDRRVIRRIGKPII
uniref:Uncharacterized protein n=1 Tax=Rhizobium rhizogenes TaxID=359 RepID=A0A7S5DT11_RHIRH|nr:hypothetical protein pC6.5c_644 [Rhizobium rhizogenes]